MYKRKPLTRACPPLVDACERLFGCGRGRGVLAEVGDQVGVVEFHADLLRRIGYAGLDPDPSPPFPVPAEFLELGVSADDDEGVVIDVDEQHFGCSAVADDLQKCIHRLVHVANLGQACLQQ